MCTGDLIQSSFATLQLFVVGCWPIGRRTALWSYATHYLL